MNTYIDSISFFDKIYLKICEYASISNNNSISFFDIMYIEICEYLYRFDIFFSIYKKRIYIVTYRFMNRYISIYPHLWIYLKSKIYYQLSYANIAQSFPKYEFQLSDKIGLFELPRQEKGSGYDTIYDARQCGWVASPSGRSLWIARTQSAEECRFRTLRLKRLLCV